MVILLSFVLDPNDRTQNIVSIETDPPIAHSTIPWIKTNQLSFSGFFKGLP